MKVLVIGGSSFIGTNLLLKSPNNWDIIATYNNSSKFTEKFINKKNIRFLKLDLINENLEDFDFFDIVFYLPTITPGNINYNNISDDSILMKIHASNLEKIILKIKKINLYIYFSSAVFYLYNNYSNYRISKILGEANIQSLANQYNFKYLILRNSEIYGPYLADHKIYNRIFNSFKSKEPSIKFNGNGENLLDTMYIDDYIQILLKIINKNINNKMLVLSRNKPMKLKDIILTYIDVFNHKIDYFFEGQSTENVKFGFNNTEMIKLLNYEPEITLKEGLSKWKKFTEGK